jgi:hypothetical protein
MEKTKYDRIKETVNLLKGLLNNGISDTNDAYSQIKAHLDEWIKTGGAATHVIEMRTYKRTAYLTLPRTADKAAEMVLKAQKPQGSS